VEIFKIIMIPIIFALLWKVVKPLMINLIDRENKRYEKEKEGK